MTGNITEIFGDDVVYSFKKYVFETYYVIGTGENAVKRTD